MAFRKRNTVSFVLGGKATDKKPGGFMAVYHDIEEICYSSTCGLSAKARVFYCIRHKILRDGLCEKHIGNEFIEAKTGLERSQIKIAIKALQKAGLIIVTHNSRKTSKGKTVYSESSYSLNPAVFGELYNWYRDNPTFRVYEGDQGKSYSNKGVVSNYPLPNPTSKPHNQTENDLTWEQVRELLLKRFPNDSIRLDRTYQQISQRGYEQEGKAPFVPQHLPAFFLKRYEYFRSEYAFHDNQSA